MYKVIFSDIDGTLRNERRTITERTKDDIRKLKKKGIEVILCSGRSRSEVERISRECGASNRYIISSNGAEVYNCINKKIEYQNAMDVYAIKELYNVADGANCTFIMNSGNVKLVNKLKYNDGIERIPNGGILKAAYDNSIMQCVILDNDFEKMKNIRNKIKGIRNSKIINESKCFIDKNAKPTDTLYYDVADICTSKGNAILKICELLNVKKEETIGIGDSYNDIELLSNVGYSVAMKNAVRGLKSRVNEVTTETNDRDGAAVFFEKILNDEPLKAKHKFIYIVNKFKK